MESGCPEPQGLTRSQWYPIRTKWDVAPSLQLNRWAMLLQVNGIDGSVQLCSKQCQFPPRRFLENQGDFREVTMLSGTIVMLDHVRSLIPPLSGKSPALCGFFSEGEEMDPVRCSCFNSAPWGPLEVNLSQCAERKWSQWSMSRRRKRMTCGAATGETTPDLVTPKVTRLLMPGDMEKITGNQTQTGAQSILHGGT